MAVIGIDLGTTYSAAAVSIDGISARILQNQEGQNITPSVVFFQDTDGAEEPLVGTMAKNAAASAPFNVVQFIKREMGNPLYKYTSPNGGDFRPEEISAIILKYIKQYSELALGEPVTDAVITVPAYFDDGRRTATKQAGKIAGLNVLQVFNEPTAAAIAYGLNTESSGKVLVYDLGGGTFDITLMNVSDGNFDVIATDGDPNLGGFDFDYEMSNLIIAELASQDYIVDEYDDMLLSEIREKAEILKRALSNVEQSSAIFTIDGKTYRVRITREQFEDATKTLLTRTRERLEILLEQQNCLWQEIDHLLMIGGSTRMPMVKQMLEEMSGKQLKHEIDPDIAVAMGAGIYAFTLMASGVGSGGAAVGDGCGAGGLPGIGGTNSETSGQSAIRISDVTSQSLGVISLNELKKEVNSIIIQNNSKIPTKASDIFSTVIDDQTELHVQVTEGNDTNVEYVKIIAEQILRIPPYPRGAPVRVTFAYDIDQTVFVEVEDLTANRSLGTFDIDRVSNLSSQEVKGLARKLDAIAVD
jgi:molecular chaperone DnaK